MGLPEGVESRILRLPGPCWIWTGAKNPRGYGNIGFKGKTYKAHRFVYERLVGPIPEGMTLDHLCFNSLCVNPEHLEPCTNAENNRRGNSLSAQRARQTHCVNGHEFNEKNTGTRARPQGGRVCRECARLREARKRARLKKG